MQSTIQITAIDNGFLVTRSFAWVGDGTRAPIQYYVPDDPEAVAEKVKELLAFF